MRILIFGLPGSGKTTFATELKTHLKNSIHFNADKIREQFNDWDFSPEGRVRQATRMRQLADMCTQNTYVIADFVAPTKHLRSIYEPDYTIWMNTIPSGRFEDTNKVFEAPQKEEYNSIVTVMDAPVESQRVLQEILNYEKLRK